MLPNQEIYFFLYSTIYSVSTKLTRSNSVLRNLHCNLSHVSMVLWTSSERKYSSRQPKAAASGSHLNMGPLLLSQIHFSSLEQKLNRYIEGNHMHRCIRMRNGLDSQRSSLLPWKPLKQNCSSQVVLFWYESHQFPDMGSRVLERRQGRRAFYTTHSCLKIVAQLHREQREQDSSYTLTVYFWA